MASPGRRASIFLAAACMCVNAQSLRDAAAERGLKIGAAAQSGLLTESGYGDALAREFNQLEAENDMKWGAIHPAQDRYNFAPGDALVSFAQSHGMAVRGHNLVWHVYNPDWLAKGTWTPAALSDILNSHIQTVASHYAGKVYAWDVVNEAFNDNGTLRDSIWYNQPGVGVSGAGYIEQAFRQTHASDPNTLLFYNDYSAETLNAKSDAIFRMVQDFRSRGVPIDGVGLQAHFDRNGVSLAGLEANIARLTGLGVQVQFTELDVRIPVDSSGRASDADLATQARIYRDVTTTCLKFPLCTSIQTWGFTDKHSWIPSTFSGFGAALPLDASYKPKPAYTSMRDAMLNAPPTKSTAVANAASYATGAISPGEIVTIFGANYGPSNLLGASLDPGGRVATDLASTRVFFDGVPAPVIYSLVNQTSVVVPFSVAGKQTTQLIYEYKGHQSAPVALPVIAALPGIFTLDGSGVGSAAALNQNGSVNSPANPAQPGSIVTLFATGAGQTTPTGTDGNLATAPLPKPLLPVTVNLGTITFAGSAPGLVEGVLQINVQLPSDIAGPTEIVVSVGGAPTQDDVVINIR